jgi:hypothetical protein
MAALFANENGHEVTVMCGCTGCKVSTEEEEKAEQLAWLPWFAGVIRFSCLFPDSHH